MRSFLTTLNFALNAARQCCNHECEQNDWRKQYVTSHVTLLAIQKIDKAWTVENGKLYERIEKEKRAIKHPARLASRAVE